MLSLQMFDANIVQMFDVHVHDDILHIFLLLLHFHLQYLKIVESMFCNLKLNRQNNMKEARLEFETQLTCANQDHSP
jgi:hypothetical protein